MRKRRPCVVLVAAPSVTTCVLSVGAAAQSMTTTWGGSVSSDYNVRANWTAGVPPTNGTAIFGAAPARTTITNVGGGGSIEVGGPRLFSRDGHREQCATLSAVRW